MEKRPLLLMLMLLPAATLAAGDPVETGRKLYEKDCAGCHASMTGGNEAALFTRPDRRVRDLTGLGRQVRACRDNLGLTLFDEDIEALVRYLDETYYHFGR